MINIFSVGQKQTYHVITPIHGYHDTIAMTQG